MKKFTFKIFFFLISTVLFSQEKEIYLNDNFTLITKAEFQKNSENELDYNLRFKTDTTFVNIKVQRIKKGKIPLKLLDSIKNNLSKNSDQIIDSNDALFINYYPGNGPCSTKGYKNNFKNEYQRFYQKFEKMENLKQFSVYKSLIGLKEFGTKIKWIPDNKNLIEKNFYPIHYPCGGYLIINSDGTYLSQRGEYCYSKTLIEKLKLLPTSVMVNSVQSNEKCNFRDQLTNNKALKNTSLLNANSVNQHHCPQYNKFTYMKINTFKQQPK